MHQVTGSLNGLTINLSIYVAIETTSLLSDPASLKLETFVEGNNAKEKFSNRTKLTVRLYYR